MNKTLTLGYSTCPNDTFLFYALAHKKIDTSGLEFNITLNDVETLNQDAKARKLDISKLSFAAIGHLQEQYGLLRTGAALGRGCGPLIVARSDFDISQLNKVKIAVPGMWTTACMLLGLFLSSNPDVVPMTFDKIMPAVVNKEFDAGVIIHEGRFTYENYGLKKLVDLGQWWEEKTSLPIPLGGIAIDRNLGPEIAKQVEKAIHDSVQYAFNNKNEPKKYIKTYAKEISPEVITQHIDLYVNDFTLNIGKEGEEAVAGLFKLARDYGIISHTNMPLFAC